MRRTLQLILASVAFAALAAPAAASNQVTFIGANSDSAAQSCTGDTGPRSSSGIVTSQATCTNAAVGTASAVAIAAPGHLAADAQADTHNGDSLGVKIGSLARTDDFITFTSTDPNATTATVAADFFLDGVMEAAVNGVANFRAFVSMAGNDADLRFALSQNGLEPVSNNGGFVLEGGQIGAVTNLHVRTNFFVVPLNSPVGLTMLIELTSGASGPGAFARADFGVNSFKFAPTAFLLDDGVTANAGDWLVNNRFVDPLAPVGGIPEPAAWALMIGGFGLAGASLRRQRREIASSAQ